MHQGLLTRTSGSSCSRIPCVRQGREGTSGSHSRAIFGEGHPGEGTVRRKRAGYDLKALQEAATHINEQQTEDRIKLKDVPVARIRIATRTV